MIDAKDYGQATLTVKEIQLIMRIGQVSAYALIRSNSFPVLRVGRSYRIPRASFVEWLSHSNLTRDVDVVKEASIDPVRPSGTSMLSQIKNGGYAYGRKKV